MKCNNCIISNTYQGWIQGEPPLKLDKNKLIIHVQLCIHLCRVYKLTRACVILVWFFPTLNWIYCSVLYCMVQWELYQKEYVKKIYLDYFVEVLQNLLLFSLDLLSLNDKQSFFTCSRRNFQDNRDWFRVLFLHIMTTMAVNRWSDWSFMIDFTNFKRVVG